jgi:hypothetical protein
VFTAEVDIRLWQFVSAACKLQFDSQRLVNESGCHLSMSAGCRQASPTKQLVLSARRGGKCLLQRSVCSMAAVQMHVAACYRNSITNTAAAQLVL